jgi:hypothetical protein
MNFSERFNARHARKADDVVGFQTGKCVVGISGMAASLGSCTAVMPPHGLSADRPARGATPFSTFVSRANNAKQTTVRVFDRR